MHNALADHLSSSRRSIDAMSSIVTNPGNAVRRVKTIFVIARPDNIVTDQSHIRKRCNCLERVFNHCFTPVGNAIRGVDDDVLLVVTINKANALFFPDFVRDANNVIDDIHVILIEPLEALTTFTISRAHKIINPVTLMHTGDV